MNKFLKEIYEQPKALEDTLQYYLGVEGQRKLETVTRIWKEGNFSHILFTGMGSSYFAAYMASCLASSYGITSFVINAGELLHYHFPLIKKETLLICISQSGESYEVVKILEKLPDGITCIGITNEEGSSLAKKAELVLPSRAGREEMTSTKTYVSTLLVLNIFSSSLAGKWNQNTIPEIKSAINAVESLVRNKEEWLAPVMEFLGRPPYIQLIGRGPSYASVMQSALMFKEGTGNPAAGIFGGEFRHGPMEMVKEGFRAVVFAVSGVTYTQAEKLVRDITKFGGKVILITNNLASFNQPVIYTIHIPCRNEFLFPIPAIVPLQFIVNQWALFEGNEPGNFTRGAKVTTTE
jgi:glutamine---fructose-6-phosphate transaminase (isomerizing)